MPEADVVVVGAGLAGLVAARELARSRRLASGAARSAKPHRRPRVYAERTALAHADRARDRVRARSRGAPLERTWQRFAEITRKAEILHGDLSAEDFLRQEPLPADDAMLFRLIVEGFHAAPLGELGMLALCEYARSASEAPEQARVRGGYGELVHRLAATLDEQVHLHLSTVAREIQWRDGGPVVVLAERLLEVEPFTAPRALITVPLGVLQTRATRDALRFVPELATQRDVLPLLAMGQVVKLTLRFRQAFWDEPALPELEFVHSAAGPFPTFWHQTHGAVQQFTAWAGGPHAIALIGEEPAALASRALDALGKLLGVSGERARAALVGFECHDFARDPFARGAYSYAHPFGNEAAHQLAQPIGDALFFAGEATDEDDPGTVAGAVHSGERAARELVDSLPKRGAPFRRSAARARFASR